MNRDEAKRLVQDYNTEARVAILARKGSKRQHNASLGAAMRFENILEALTAAPAIPPHAEVVESALLRELIEAAKAASSQLHLAAVGALHRETQKEYRDARDRLQAALEAF